jgi:hypothetical protein
MLGAAVDVSFELPDKSTFKQTFRMGNLVEHLKAGVMDKIGIDFDEQELYLDSKLMADPLMLRDIWQNPEKEMKVVVKQIKTTRKKAEPKPVIVDTKVKDNEEYEESSEEEEPAQQQASGPPSLEEAMLANNNAHFGTNFDRSGPSASLRPKGGSD